MRAWIGLCSLLICAIGTTHAAEPGVVVFNQVKKIGDAAPAWKNLPGTDAKQHSLVDYEKIPVVVVVFTCNSCPTARDYEDRILALVKQSDQQHPGQVQVVAINVNKVPDDSLEHMTKRAKERGFTFPYLLDESQQIAKDFGAITTPQFFVLNSKREIVYMGAMDDATDASKATKHFVQAAITATLAGQTPAITSEPPRGCLIRFARERKK